MGIIPLIAAIGATTGFAGILIGKSFANFNIDEKWNQLENYRDQVKAEFNKQKEAILKLRDQLVPIDTYVVLYNTKIPFKRCTAIVELPGDTVKAATLKMKLVEKIKQMIPEESCEYVAHYPVTEYVDFTLDLRKNKNDSEMKEFSTVNERYRELVAA